MKLVNQLTEQNQQFYICTFPAVEHHSTCTCNFVQFGPLSAILDYTWCHKAEHLGTAKTSLLQAKCFSNCSIKL